MEWRRDSVSGDTSSFCGTLSAASPTRCSRKAGLIEKYHHSQGYVGNILEPTVFGKSLNVTALSVLLALVLWGSIWGIQGAVLSVPLLAAMKVALEECDYPLAKMLLGVIRESASIDDAVQAQVREGAYFRCRVLWSSACQI